MKLTPTGNSRSSALPERLFEVFLFSLPFLVASLHVKYANLTVGALRDFRGAFGLVHVPALTYLGLFAGELWESLVLFPLVLLLLGWFVNARWRILLYFLILELALLVNAVQWATSFTLGDFLTKELLSDFWSTLRTHPEFVSTSSLLPSRRLQEHFYAFFALGFVPLAFVLVRRIREHWNRSYRILLCGIGVVLILAGFVPLRVTGHGYYTAGPLERVGAEMFRPDEIPAETASNHNALPPLEYYNQTVFPEGRGHSESTFTRPAGLKSRPNVIFVVLETTGARDYPMTEPSGNMPNVAALVPHSLVAKRHYSADVESGRSGFNIYSSLYELPGRGKSQYFVTQLDKVKNPRPLDGLPRILAGYGYASRYYFPFTPWPKRGEESQWRHLGFESVCIAEETQGGDTQKDYYALVHRVSKASPEERMATERAMYEMALRDMEKLHAEHRPFFFSIVATIGHSPYIDLRSPAERAKGPASREVLIANLAAFQDQLIGGIVSKLRQMGILDDTILMITGDHGPRSTVDDPQIDLPYLSEVSYHVPLLIHYPAAFPEPVVIQRVTSHIDLVPTVLELMGLNKPGYLHQGLSMFDKALDDRATFFLGEHFFAASGMHYRGQFVMWFHKSSTVYMNNRFFFDARTMIADPGKNQAASRLVPLFDAFKKVQWEWLSYLRSSPEREMTRSVGRPWK